MVLDIHTKEILGRGTKRGRLYYVDDFSPGMANSVTHPFDSKQKQIWLWHRQLGHPSVIIPQTDETQFNAQIQILRSDNGGEFVNHDFQTYFQQHGIIHETTCPQTPQQNGVAERKNRHLLETARALLIGAHVPRHHWDDAIVTAVHLINRMPSGVLTLKLPYRCLHNTDLCLLFWYSHPEYLDVWLSFISTKINVANLIHVRFVGEIRSEEQNWSNLENKEILLCTEMIDHFESGARDYLCRKATNLPFIAINCLTHLIHAKIFLIRVSHLQTIQNNKMKTPSNSTVPTDQSPENILEVTTPTRLVHLDDKTIGYQLPFRQNREPPNRYSPDIGKTSKYPIANHVSTEKLSEPLKAFVHQLSAIHIPTRSLKH
ncbi:receptor like protein 35 [Prunus dulcis]|uniref:Receptor like protein 35 n=1 Tax=Prunus dulcis TaxID=3755 RepID=A0A4Y1QWB7_PRUDU|nr:receptor like protein 35 [Prunus dulcis]